MLWSVPPETHPASSIIVSHSEITGVRIRVRALKIDERGLQFVFTHFVLRLARILFQWEMGMGSGNLALGKGQCACEGLSEGSMRRTLGQD